MATLVVASGTLLASHVQAEAPKGWKTIKDNGKGQCQMAVPESWKLAMLMGQPLGSADSPDKKSSAVVNAVNMPFAQSKGLIVQSLKVTKMIEDSATRQVFEFSGLGAKPGNLNLYIGIKTGNGTCNAQISVPPSQTDVGQKIAASLGAS